MPSSARVLFSTGSLHLLDVSQCFALAAEAGFDGIEIMCDDRYSTRDPHYLSELATQHNLPVLAVHTPFSPKIPGWGYSADQVNRIERTLDLAEKLASEVIVVHVPARIGAKMVEIGGIEQQIPALSNTAAVKRWIEEKLPHVQRKTKVKITLENMPRKEIVGFKLDPFWWNEIDSWSTAHDYLTMDTTHWGTKKVDPLVAYEAAKARIVHVHLSNYYNGEEHHLPHKGDLKLGKLLETMATDGYAGTISLEVHPKQLDYKQSRAVRRKLKEAVNFCRRHLGQKADVREAFELVSSEKE
jgi:sugar phosphate isomerase/epimerase